MDLQAVFLIRPSCLTQSLQEKDRSFIAPPDMFYIDQGQV